MFLLSDSTKDRLLYIAHEDQMLMSLIWLKDAGNQTDCINAVKTTIEQLGGLDVLVSNSV